MSEAENVQASRESRAGVVSRAGQSAGYGDVVQRLVEAAVYREAHRAAPNPPAQNADAPDTTTTEVVLRLPCRPGGQAKISR